MVGNKDSLKVGEWGWTHVQTGCGGRLAVSGAPAPFLSFWHPSSAPRVLADVLGWAVGARGRSHGVTAVAKLAKLLRSLLPILLPRGHEITVFSPISPRREDTDGKRVKRRCRPGES